MDGFHVSSPILQYSTLVAWHHDDYDIYSILLYTQVIQPTTILRERHTGEPLYVWGFHFNDRSSSWSTVLSVSNNRAL